LLDEFLNDMIKLMWDRERRPGIPGVPFFIKK
jgi:hypothetical protein